MTTLVSRTFLKQEAKKLKKILDISHSEALDRVSKKYGFSNYKHYLNVLEKSKPVKEDKIPLENETSKKIQFETPFEHSDQMPFYEQLDFLRVFQQANDIQAQCEKWHLMKNEIQSALFNEFLTEEGQYEVDFRYKYYIAKGISVSDLKYEMKGGILCVDGDYDLKIKFDCDEELPDEPHFKDHVLSGPFGIKIDRNKNITIHHLSIIETIDGLVYAGTLKPTARLMPPFRPEVACISL